MASDLSSGCTETIEILDGKEEGEISLEDVSSCEEGHLNSGYGVRASQCPSCLSTQHCATWCTTANKLYHSKNRRDAVQGKENRHYIKESGCTGTKYAVSTLQEKNDDLVPISSDSDMEIIGRVDNSKQIMIRSISRTRTKKKKRKRKDHVSALMIDDLVSPSSIDLPVTDQAGMKASHLSRSHHRELSPVHKSSRPRIVSRSPSRRHRSSPARVRSPFKKSRSPVSKIRSPILRRSPRRLRSPYRSPHRSPIRPIPKKITRTKSPPTHTYIDMYGNVSKLLKRVRHLDAIANHSSETGGKSKDTSSLKEKLNMMKNISDNNGNVTNYSKEKGSINVKDLKNLNDPDDEDDLALLRQKALETKQKKSNKSNEQSKTEVDTRTSYNAEGKHQDSEDCEMLKTENEAKTIVYNDDDHDEEDLKLRMIALRSAILKKHQNRVQRGVKSKKSKKSTVSHNESPFTQSFLDSIPIPGEELLNFASPPCTPPPLNESNHTEDMELDTDIEREKEKLPYSPTDKITTDIPIDTEVLGIQPSDVSFIRLSESNKSPLFNVTSMADEQKLQPKIIENKSYLPTMTYYAETPNAYGLDAPYSPTDPTETPRPDFINSKKYDSCISQFAKNTVDSNLSQEMPYSPTDTPIHDPDLPQTLPFIQTSSSTTSFSNSTSISQKPSYNNSVYENIVQYSHPIVYPSQNIDSKRSKHFGEGETSHPNISPENNSHIERTSTTESLTVSDLLITDTDANSLMDAKNSQSKKYIPDNIQVMSKTQEPLYMQGVPDVTKDVNKIPTLINRTLVPAPILKSNKQLQQPLPTKKPETPREPTFKSAKMQPVVVNVENNTKSNTTFKPIKLISSTKKPQSLLSTSVAFDNSLNDDNDKEAKSKILADNKNKTSVLDSSNSDDPIKHINDEPTDKQKKSKKVIKRRTISITQYKQRNANIKIKISRTLPTEITAPTCTANEESFKGKEIIENVCEQKEAKTGSDNQNQLENENSVQQIKDENLSVTANIVHLINNDIDTRNTNSPEIHPENESNSKNAILTSNIVKDKHVEHSLNDTENTVVSSDVANKVKETNERRQSLEEDEDALRAILLASLAKRSKSSDTAVSCTMPVTTLSDISDINSCGLINKAQADNVLPTTSVINTTNTESNVSLPTQLTNINVVENERNQSNITTLEVAATKNHSSNSIPVASNLGKKRSISLSKSSTKKLVKKISIPASTKVVNNAKKYQNTIVQRKLNLQKNVTLHSNKKLTESKSLSMLKSSIKSSMLSDTQRIVINLQSDTDSDSDSERQITATSSSSSVNIEKAQSSVNPLDFEKIVDQFLRDVRKKQESAAAAKPIITSQMRKDVAGAMKAKSAANLHTPLALLPASKQEEYRRLKQQIREREKLRSQRAIENATSKQSTRNVIPSTSPKLVLPSVSQKESLNTNLNQQSSLNLRKQIVNSPSLKEDNLKNVPVTVASDIKQTNTAQLQSKGATKPITNFSVTISNKIPSAKNNNGVKTTECSEASLNEKQITNAENIISPQETIKTKSSPSLKVLSKDELNQKYIQIQVNQELGGRLVTINNKTDSTETLDNEETGNFPDISNTIQGNINDVNNIVTAMDNKIKEKQANINEEKDNQVIDSDASTIILSKECRMNQETSLDITESTMDLSSYQRNNCLCLSTMKHNDDENCSLEKSSVTEDIKDNTEEIQKLSRTDVNKELNAFVNFSREEQEKYLTDIEYKLVMKRYMIVDDLADMSGNLRQWSMERDLQTSLVAEVKKLREQLRVAEEKLQMQRNQMNNMGPQMMATRKKINARQRECTKLSKICLMLGTRIYGQNYKVPEAGIQLLMNRLKEVTSHSRHLSKKKVAFINIHENCIRSPSPQRLLSSVLDTKIMDLGSPEKVDENDICNDDDCEDIVMTENCNHIEQNMVEEALHTDSIAMVLNEVALLNEDEETIDSQKSDNDKPNVSEQNNNVLAVQTDSSNGPVMVTDVPVTAQSKQVLQVSVPSTSLKSCEPKAGLLQQDNEHTKKIVEPYESILMHLRASRNTNPNGVLCPYELMGTCSDNDCQFIHQSHNQ